MLEIERTTGTDPRSRRLREAMDAETYPLYADSMAAMPAEARDRLLAALTTDQADLVEVVLAVKDGTPVGHAALRRLAEGGLEVKKVYVVPAARGHGVSRLLMSSIEGVARDLGETRIRLQTGPLQGEAIALYRSIGYVDIPEFGPYAGLEDMVYMGKAL